MNKFTLSELLDELPKLSNHHVRNGVTHKIFSKALNEYIENSKLTDSINGEINLGNFGNVKLPYYNMGNIDTLNLFDLDELIIFSFYWHNRNKYKNVADLGANVGLHSILMSKCGWNVHAFEPDPQHIKCFKKNINLNASQNITVNECAVSILSGEAEFTRVIGNTTSSHISNAKDNAYGKLEKFIVKTIPFNKIISQFDFIKMDVEGEEANIVKNLTLLDINGKEIMMEVGTKKNAEIIYKHCMSNNISMYSQKINWMKVKHLPDMPFSYKDGSLFISNLRDGPWIL